MNSQSPSSSSSSSKPSTSSTPYTTISSSPTTSSSIGITQASSSSSRKGTITKTKPLQVLIKFPTTRKRKGQTKSSNPPKMIKTIIDCPVALTLLKELGLGTPFFNSGKVLAWALDPTDPDFIRIHDYVYRGQDQWTSFGAKVCGILRIMSKVDSLQNADVPSDFNEDPMNKGQLRKMLWHGTPSANVPKILENGLKLPEHSGLYGKGIYFADRFDLSVCYSRIWGTGNKAYLFLYDVLLGNDLYQTTSAFDFYVDMKVNWPWQPSKLFPLTSVQGRGSWIPDPRGDQMIDGCVWPMGEGSRDISIRLLGFLHRNIYVIYNEMRVIPKYLVQVQITNKPVVPEKMS